MGEIVHIRKYACPYRTKHKVKYGYKFYCLLTHKECTHNPSRCPIRRRAESKVDLMSFLEK